MSPTSSRGRSRFSSGTSRRCARHRSSSRRRRIRTRPRPRHAGIVAVALAAFALAGCGGGERPRLADADAAPLIALSQRIVREGNCAQARDIRKLQAHTTALVNAHRVPARLQDALLAGVNQLATQAPVCVPRVTPVATAPPAPTKPEPEHGHGHKHHGHGHGHDQGDEGGE